VRSGDGHRLSYYDVGRTPFFALRADPRVSYCLYVPEGYAESGSREYPLVVLVHGTTRAASDYRDWFAPFAEEHGCIVLAPLFPANLFGPRDLDNYKRVESHGVRFDRLLLAMVDEVAAKYRLRGERFLLHGFSGGAHFAHRFFYLHPQRLRAVSIGAPGLVTLLDERWDWWAGLRDVLQRFGVAPDVGRMRGVAVQMVIGGEDVETWEITIDERSAWWMEGAEVANAPGTNRLARLESLRRSFEAAGIAVRHDVVEGAGHEGAKILGPVRDFFAGALER
jgi:poly(3-hydroxybutyrate) depolymerase